MDDRALADRLAARTLELCRIASPVGQEEAIANHLGKWARAHFSAEAIDRVENTLVLGRIDPARPNVGLFGHLDTVPSHPGDGEPRLDDGSVIGLGASDMKGALAVMTLLVEMEATQESPFNVLHVMYEREEGPYAENGLGPLFEKRRDLTELDFAICLEPSDSAIQLGCCGSLHATVAFDGRSAHSARPWQGENAIHKAGPLLTRLRDRPVAEVEVGGLVFREAMSATLASGGRARNVVPESFSVNVNFRFAPSRTLDEAKAALLAVVAGEGRVTFTDLAPAGPVCADHPLLKRLVERTGATVEPKQAWTDVARLGLFGIATVSFGPGQSAQAHQANERVEIASLVRGCRLFERFLAQ